MKHKLLYPIISFFVLIPLTSHALLGQTTEIVYRIGVLVKILIPIVGALALLYFFWGLAKFILHADNDEARAGGKKIMMWGIVALFVLVSIWGIVQYMMREIGVNFVGQSWVPGFYENQWP